jgi:hypothetical protein
MHHEVFFMSGLMDMVAGDGEIAELQGQYFIEEVVMIAADVDHFSVSCGQPFHDEFKEGGMFLFPFAGFAELPAIDDIAVEDERITDVVAEEMDGFFDSGVLYAEVNVRHDNGTIVRLQWFGVSQN